MWMCYLFKSTKTMQNLKRIWKIFLKKNWAKESILYLCVHMYLRRFWGCTCMCGCTRMCISNFPCSPPQTSLPILNPVSEGFLWSIIFFKIEVYLIYNVGLVSGIQLSDSVVHIYTYSFSCSFPLWFITGYWMWFLVLYRRSLLFTY